MVGVGLVSVGAVAASVGLTLFGMGTSFAVHDDGLKNIGLVLMIGGIVVLAVGMVIYRNNERDAEANQLDRS